MVGKDGDGASPLRLAEDGVLRAVAGSRSMIFEVDADFRYVGVWTQNERLLLRPAQEVLGRRMQELLPEPLETWATEVTARVLETGEPSAIDYELDVPEGRRWFHADLQRLVRADGSRTALIHIRDITDHKTAEESLREAQARLMVADRMASLGTLAAGVAHEINNPLAYAMTNVQWAVDRVDDAKLRATLEEAIHGIERVRDIVRDLKVLTRPPDASLDRVDLAPIIRTALQMARHETKHRARVVCDLGESLIVDGDEGRLSQLFLNLLVNAAQAIPEGAVDENEIRVVARKVDDTAVIEVSDSGAGMPPDVLARVFDPFFTTKPSGLGTGLGLSICQGIVTQLGGTITATSRVELGTTFRLVLPLAAATVHRSADGDDHPEDITAPLARPDRPRPPAAAERRRVLVIDDEIHLARAIARILDPVHDVTAVHSAQAGIDLLAAGERYDLILCDLMMPEMTGMGFHAELASRWPGLLDRLTFLTGGVVSPTAQSFLSSVEQPCLEKPFGFEDLIAFVGRHLPHDAGSSVSRDA